MIERLQSRRIMTHGVFMLGIRPGSPHKARLPLSSYTPLASSPLWWMGAPRAQLPPCSAARAPALSRSISICFSTSYRQPCFVGWICSAISFLWVCINFSVCLFNFWSWVFTGRIRYFVNYLVLIESDAFDGIECCEKNIWGKYWETDYKYNLHVI